MLGSIGEGRSPMASARAGHRASGIGHRPSQGIGPRRASGIPHHA
ncbi:hypothetical protein QUB56_29735 [Microcoleus sp. AR_TQ3_B6]